MIDIHISLIIYSLKKKKKKKPQLKMIQFSENIGCYFFFRDPEIN